jgi:serine/threonine protein kinase
MDTPIWKTISKDAINFVTQLLRIDPDSRLTAHAACIHHFIRRTKTLSNVTPDPELLRKVTDNLARYANSCDVKKIALMVIANKLSTQEIFDLRNIFYEFDTSNDGMITFEELKKALSRSSYTEKELHAIFKSIVSLQMKVITWKKVLLTICIPEKFTGCESHRQYSVHR